MVVDEVVMPGDNVVPHYNFFLCLWVWWYSSVSLRIVFVSNTRMFEYRLVMSSEASVKCGAIGVSCNFWSRYLR
jgi:hypothetical protein